MLESSIVFWKRVEHEQGKYTASFLDNGLGLGRIIFARLYKVEYR